MELENRACLVLASTEDVIADIKTSLGLLKMEVRGGIDAVGAKAELFNGEPPVIALLEKDLPGKPDEGISVAESIRNHPQFSHVLVCLLIDSEDLSGDLPEGFDGAFKLPVEFPTFTREVKKFAESWSESAFEQRKSEAILVHGATEQEAIKSGSIEAIPRRDGHKEVKPAVPEAPRDSYTSEHSHVPQSSEKRLLNRRFVVAYGIQLAVLEALERDAQFQHATAEEIPELIAVVTERVVGQFDVSALLGAAEREKPEPQRHGSVS